MSLPPKEAFGNTDARFSYRNTTNHSEDYGFVPTHLTMLLNVELDFRGLSQDFLTSCFPVLEMQLAVVHVPLRLL